MATIPVSSYVQVNGVRLHVLDWGGVGEPILIAHATGFLGRIYAPIAERLTSIGHVYSYDQRGHGESSSAPNNAYSWELARQDLEAFIVAMGWKGIRAVGHSIGGTTLAVLAAERPELISKAVILDPIVMDIRPGAQLRENPMRDRALKRRRSFESVEAMFADYSAKPQFMTWDKKMLRDYCEYGTRQTSDGKRELKCLPEVEARIYDTFVEFDALTRLLPGTIPLLVLFAEKGPCVHLAEKLRNHLKNSRVEVVPGLGHLMAMEDPDLVANKALAFLSTTQA